jgi:hypothetical protein
LLPVMKRAWSDEEEHRVGHFGRIADAAEHVEGRRRP